MLVPKVSTRNANQPRWFTPIIQHKVKCLHTLRRRYEKHPTELNKLTVNKTVIDLQLAMTEAKSNYESNLLIATHHNKIYQYITNVKGEDNFPTQMFYNNQHTCTKQEKAQLFNNYFYSVFSTDSITPVSKPPMSTSTGTSHGIEINESEILTTLSSLDGNKAPGIDNICPRVYRHCALPLLKTICHLFAVSPSSGSIPSQWCTHWITPIYKSVYKFLVSNYHYCVYSRRYLKQ